MSKIYKLSLKQKSGLLTELESDTIFGHFCWRMVDLLGDQKLEEFLEIHKHNPVFTTSNGCFERDDIAYLPNPHIPFCKKNDQNSLNNKTEKIRKFLEYKASKELKLLSLEQFNHVLNGNIQLGTPVEEDKFTIPYYSKDLRTSVEIDRATMKSKEGQLFSYSPKYIKEVLVDKESNRYSNTNTIIFIKVLDDKNFQDYDCENLIKEIFHVGYGKKKSSGYGEFEVISFTEFNGFQEPEDSDAFITLSNYIPSKEDSLVDYFYDFKVKYGKYGEEWSLSENPFKKPLVFLLPGSVFITNTKKDFYGRCVHVSDLHSQTIQNGFAFTLKISVPKQEPLSCN